jgi:hypothetical protein
MQGRGLYQVQVGLDKSTQIEMHVFVRIYLFFFFPQLEQSLHRVTHR